MADVAGGRRDRLRRHAAGGGRDRRSDRLARDRGLRCTAACAAYGAGGDSTTLDDKPSSPTGPVRHAAIVTAVAATIFLLAAPAIATLRTPPSGLAIAAAVVGAGRVNDH